VTTRDARSRAERLDLLTRVLRDRPGITAAELAREMGVSARSIFRDLDALRERGYPIDASRGRGGGLRLHPNWGLGRVLLARDEALGTLLGLAVTEKLGFPMFGAELSRARRKIADAFPSAERRQIAPLRERILIGPAASADVRRSYRDPSPLPMRRLQAAFVDERLVRVEYTKEGGAAIERRLEPHALVINWPAWYLLAHDLVRGESRTYRLDRFAAVEIEAETFRLRPQHFFQELLETTGVAASRP
jgi:predicted DNA-binding transcriptional regulator YafY